MKISKKVKKAIIGIGLILTLGAGMLIGAGAFPRTITHETIREVPVEVFKTVEVPVETIKTVEKMIEVPVPLDMSDYVNKAILDVEDKMNEDEWGLSCGDYEYDPDEISVKRIYDVASFNQIKVKDEKYSVTFRAKYEFDDPSDDETACKETRTYKVTYENGEDPIVELVE